MTTDLIKIAEQGVIEKARLTLARWATMGTATGAAFDAAKLAYNEAQCDLLAAVTLLEERERTAQSSPQPMTAPHDSATCALGTDGGPCEQCRYARLMENQCPRCNGRLEVVQDEAVSGVCYVCPQCSGDQRPAYDFSEQQRQGAQC